MINTEEFSTAVEEFNEKYGVEFNYADFEKERIKYDRMDIDKPGNVAYAFAFAKLYKRALRAAVTGNIKDLNSPEMMKDFEEKIMAPYRAKCIEQNEPNGSAPYGGKTRLKALESMRAYANEAPKTVADFYGEKYQNGLLHLRDFRSFAEHYTKTVEQQEMAANFIVGLEKVHNNRSFLWKVAHPIQNYCEKRDLKYLKSELEYDKIKYLADSGSEILEAEMQYLDKLIRVEKNGTGETVERKKVEQERESIYVEDADESIDEVYNDQVVEEDINLSRDSVTSI